MPKPVKKTERTPRGRGFNVSPERSFGYLLRDSARLLISLMTRKIEEHGISLSQYFILRELWEDDGLSLQELAERTRIASPSIATCIDDLEAAGLVKRVRNTGDRRRVCTNLTAKGRALRGVMLRYAIEVNEAALSGMTASEIDLAKDLLQRVKANLSMPVSEA
jgi:MarR family transcriptional regulator, organic hydroperoxide resistance regulator